MVIVGNQEIINGHAADCPVHEDGPCVCGTEEILDELALEDADLSPEDFE